MQSGFAILVAAAAERVTAAVAQVSGAAPETRVPLPTAGMTMSTGQVELVVSQGGGGYGDPLEREPDLVVADVAEGLVSPDAARLVYGVVVEAAPGYPRLDQGATATRRDAIRTDRLGGRTPRPPTAVAGRRFSEAFAIEPARGAGTAEMLVCRRCGFGLCPTTENLYDHLLVRTSATSARDPTRPALRGQRGVRDTGLLLPVLRPPGRRPGRPGRRTRPAGHRAAGAGY